MKPTLTTVVFLQFILVLFLLFNHFSTASRLSEINLLLSSKNNSFDLQHPIQSEFALPETISASKDLHQSNESSFSPLELTQLHGLLENVLSEKLQESNNNPTEKNHANSLLKNSPAKGETYFRFNDQVSNYIAEGGLSEQAFTNLSQEMISLHPKHKQQLLMRLARELNKQ